MIGILYGLKALSDLALFLAFFGILVQMNNAVILISLLSTWYGMTYAFQYKKWLYLFPVIAILFAIVNHVSFLGLIGVALMGGYIAYLLYQKQFELSSFIIRDQFSMIIKVYPFYFVFSLLFVKFNTLVTYSVPYLFLYLLTSIYLMRVTRNDLNEATLIKQMRKDGVPLLILTMSGLVLSIQPVRNALVSMFRFVYLKTLYPILYGILYFLGNLVFQAFEQLDLKGILSKNELGEFGMPELPVIEDAPGNTIGQAIFSGIFYLIAIIIVCLILYYIFKKFTERAYARTSVHSISSIQLSEATTQNRSIRLNPFQDGVRYLYRRYLRKLEKHDVPLVKSDTSLDILKRSTKILGEKESQTTLRDIYLPVRYRNESDNTFGEFTRIYRQFSKKLKS